MPPTAIQDVLARVFGFPAFREGQEPVVRRLLEGKSCLAIFPTGGGKSLCYQLPALMLEGLTVVLSPLIALMKDQIDFLISHGVPAARLDSSLDRQQALEAYDGLNSGRIKILYVSPERLGNERFLQSLARRRVSLLAVDEAHCISEWGHNFRPDYLKIATLARQLKVERVLALTATATPDVARDIARQFAIAEDDVVHTGFYRPNLRLAVTPCEAGKRNEVLLARLRKRPRGPTIVYVTLQRTAEQVAEFLSVHGFPAQAYHAGMEAEERHAIQDAFMASDQKIIVATIAFGMGIDKSDIRYVYHYNLPKGLESYAQEIGRAGRDGRESVCELLACADDVVVLENFSYGDTPTPEAVRGLVHDILGRGPEFDLSVYELSGIYDVRPLVVETLLAYLELENLIHATGPFYSQYKFQPQKSSQEILARFDAPRAEFLREVFRTAKKGKTWFMLDLDDAARQSGQTRERIVAALGYLEELGDLVLQVAGVREGYRLQRKLPALGPLAEQLNRRFQQREEHDIARIHRMLRYAEEPGCLTRHVLAYFGQEHGDCGHCSRCSGQPAKPLAPPRYSPLGPAEAEQVRRLREEGIEALTLPRQLARFLCGIASPATTRAKLRNHPMFGQLESVPFKEVLEFVEES